MLFAETSELLLLLVVRVHLLFDPCEGRMNIVPSGDEKGAVMCLLIRKFLMQRIRERGLYIRPTYSHLNISHTQC